METYAISREIAKAIYRNKAERDSNTPDYILADFLTNVIVQFSQTMRLRDEWYGVDLRPDRPRAPRKRVKFELDKDAQVAVISVDGKELASLDANAPGLEAAIAACALLAVELGADVSREPVKPIVATESPDWGSGNDKIPGQATLDLEAVECTED
jgi:hypothetical protein